MSAGRWARCALLVLLGSALPLPALAALQVLIVEGLGGTPSYTRAFDVDVARVRHASESLTSPGHVRVLAGAAATRTAVLAALHALAGRLTSQDTLALYLIGHGSYDGVQYRFNLPGPDLTGRDLSAALNAVEASPQLVVATGSSSGALQPLLRRAGRIVITGTRNGFEKNATRFSSAFAAALSRTSADTDKDKSISAEEAYRYATRQVDDFYKREKLLATEHPTLEGKQAPLFTVALLAPRRRGPATALTRRRDRLEQQIQRLRLEQGKLSPAVYSARIQPLLIELARVQQRIDQAARSPPAKRPAPARPAAGNAKGASGGS